MIINRGITPEGGTRIGEGSFIMAETHIGHDSVIEGSCVLGNGVKIAGDCHVGKYTILSSNAILHNNGCIGEWALIKGGCRISGNVPPFTIMAHNPVVYFGVNAFVLRRKGFSEDIIDDIAKAYHEFSPEASWNGSNYTNATTGVKADNTFLVYQDTYIMGDPGWFMHATEVEVPEKYFTVK